MQYKEFLAGICLQKGMLDEWLKSLCIRHHLSSQFSKKKKKYSPRCQKNYQHLRNHQESSLHIPKNNDQNRYVAVLGESFQEPAKIINTLIRNWDLKLYTNSSSGCALDNIFYTFWSKKVAIQLGHKKEVMVQHGRQLIRLLKTDHSSAKSKRRSFIL
jgi:uncharacterized protein YeaO (DUF488 family)